MFEKKTKACQRVLINHCKRSNIITYIWKQSLIANIGYPDIGLNGWHQDGSIHWVDEHFPSEIQDILVQDEIYDTDSEFFGSDEESSTDDEDF